VAQAPCAQRAPPRAHPGDEDAGHGGHGGAAVHQLGLHIPLERLGVLALGGWGGGEGHRSLASVGAWAQRGAASGVVVGGARWGRAPRGAQASVPRSRASRGLQARGRWALPQGAGRPPAHQVEGVEAEVARQPGRGGGRARGQGGAAVRRCGARQESGSATRLPEPCCRGPFEAMALRGPPAWPAAAPHAAAPHAAASARRARASLATGGWPHSGCARRQLPDLRPAGGRV
jgi:hypothetical protein